MKHAEYLDAGAVPDLAIKYQVVRESIDDSGTDILVTAELPV